MKSGIQIKNRVRVRGSLQSALLIEVHASIANLYAFDQGVRANAQTLDPEAFVRQDLGVNRCETSTLPAEMPVLAWDERALIDWEAGIRAGVHAWLGPGRPTPGSQELADALARAESSARASTPASFLEWMRRVYLSLAQDLAFAPRQSDLLDLESRLLDFLPRAGVVQRLSALRKAGFALAWLQESESSIASQWRSKIGVPFQSVIELGPVHRCLSETTARAISRQRHGQAGGFVLVRGPGRDTPGDVFSKATRDGFAGEVCWPNPKLDRLQGRSSQGTWQRKVAELLS